MKYLYPEVIKCFGWEWKKNIFEKLFCANWSLRHENMIVTVPQEATDKWQKEDYWYLEILDQQNGGIKARKLTTELWENCLSLYFDLTVF